MLLYRFHDPHCDEFAVAGRRGTWSPSTELCPECTASSKERVSPLVIEWDKPARAQVGDFSWPGFDSDALVSERASQVLAAFDGWEPGPVEVVGPIRHSEEFQLRDLWVTAWADLDPARSSVDMERRCGTCGRECWTLRGEERIDSTWDPDKGSLNRERVPRSGPGVVLHPVEAPIMRVRQFPAWIFCTEPVRTSIVEAGCTNVDFLEVGEVQGVVD